MIEVAISGPSLFETDNGLDLLRQAHAQRRPELHVEAGRLVRCAGVELGAEDDPARPLAAAVPADLPSEIPADCPPGWRAVRA